MFFLAVQCTRRTLVEHETILGEAYINVGRTRTYALIDQLREHEAVDLVCSVLDISSPSYYDHRHRSAKVDTERLELRSEVNRLFHKSRSSAGSRLRELGYDIGRFKVMRLMEEAGLICKQPGSHAYKTATVEHPDIPNRLNREFDASAPNQAWCGDITYVWAGVIPPVVAGAIWLPLLICIHVVSLAGLSLIRQMLNW